MKAQSPITFVDPRDEGITATIICISSRQDRAHFWVYLMQTPLSLGISGCIFRVGRRSRCHLTRDGSAHLRPSTLTFQPSARTPSRRRNTDHSACSNHQFADNPILVEAKIRIRCRVPGAFSKIFLIGYAIRLAQTTAGFV